MNYVYIYNYLPILLKFLALIQAEIQLSEHSSNSFTCSRYFLL